jgi:hypothetical protein
MSINRHLAMARRAERGTDPTARYGLGSRVLAAREPKLLLASTRLAAARTRVAPAPAVALDEPALGAAVPQTLWRAAAPARGTAPAPVSAPTPRSPGGWEERGNSSPFLPKRPAARMEVARAAEPTPAAGPPEITPESLGIGPASFEWLFGDPDKALAHPDVTAGPVVSLPPLSPQQRSARRVARLTARGGSAYGRGARIAEGPAKPADPPAPAPAADSPAPATPVDGGVPAERGAARTAAPELPAPSPVAEVPAPALQRVARVAAPAAPSPHDRTPPPLPARDETLPASPARDQTPTRDHTPPPRPARDQTPPAPSPPARQRLVAGRRPAAAQARELARAAVDPAPAPTPGDAPAVTSPAPSTPAPTPAAAPAVTALARSNPTPTPAAAPAPAAAGPAASRTPPPPPSPGPPPVRRMAAPPRARTAPVRPTIARRQPTPPARPTIHRASRPPAATASAPAPRAPAPAAPSRPPSLLRRALAAITRSAPQQAAPRNFGVSVDTYTTPAPSAARTVARMARAAPQLAGNAPQPPRPAAQPARPAPQSARPAAPMALDAHVSLSPHRWTPPDAAPLPLPHLPPERAPAEPSSQQLSRAPAAPAPTPPTDPDLAYRDLLTRVREEREQLGQLISHPF